MLASDAEREGALRRLRSCHAEGLLGMETYEQRVGDVLHAVRREQLRALLADLPTLRTALRDTVAGRRFGAASGALEVPLPDWDAGPLVLGRSRSCDVVLTGDDTVSGRHAELRPLVDVNRWLLVDLGSLNGTFFLGRRIGRTVVRAGDELLVGRTALRLH